MRLWVKPDQLAKLNITVTEIVNAIQAQNKVNPAGQIGGEPAPANQQFTYSVLAQGRLTSPEQFENVVVREAPDGGIVRVKDVARVELGEKDYSVVSRLNGRPAAIIALYQLPGSNAVQTAGGVRKLMAEMKQRFPQDMDYAISLDQTSAVTEGMKEIIQTLFDRYRPGAPCGLPLPARLARYPDPHACRARFTCGHVYSLPAVRLFHQYPFDVRTGAGHRLGGR